MTKKHCLTLGLILTLATAPAAFAGRVSLMNRFLNKEISNRLISHLSKGEFSPQQAAQMTPAKKRLSSRQSRARMRAPP